MCLLHAIWACRLSPTHMIHVSLRRRSLPGSASLPCPFPRPVPTAAGTRPYKQLTRPRRANLKSPLPHKPTLARHSTRHLISFWQRPRRFGRHFRSFGQGFRRFGQRFRRFGQRFRKFGRRFRRFGQPRRRFGQRFRSFGQHFRNFGQGFRSFGRRLF